MNRQAWFVAGLILGWALVSLPAEVRVWQVPIGLEREGTDG